MRLSIVTTLYHSAPYLREFCARAAAAARRLTEDYELVLVNDGSPDDALAVALDLQRDNGRLRVIDLSRNFGHHPAIMTGLAHARGDWVFLIDCDLEEDPELLGRFEEVRVQTGADVVFGVQQARSGGALNRLLARLYYRVFNLLSTEAIPENMLTARLMSRRYVRALLRHREVEFVLSGLWQRTGFHQVPVPVAKKVKGSTTYNPARKLAVLVNSVTSFSARPLYWIFYLGCTLFILSTCAATYLVVRRLFFGVMLEGWPSLMVSIWMLGGLMLLGQGVIGIYLSKVFMEAKRRPRTVVRAVYEPPRGDPAPAANGVREGASMVREGENR
jgi:putative glycosyltransferase